jgi:hypothetical protein
MSPIWKPWDEIQPGDIRCTDPETLERAAAIAVAAMRRKEAVQGEGTPDAAK